MVIGSRHMRIVESGLCATHPSWLWQGTPIWPGLLPGVPDRHCGALLLLVRRFVGRSFAAGKPGSAEFCNQSVWLGQTVKAQSLSKRRGRCAAPCTLRLWACGHKSKALLSDVTESCLLAGLF